MDAAAARDSIIKPKLAEIFGRSNANMLVGRSMAAAAKGSSEQEKFKLMVDFICSDPKVVGMWGNAQAQKQSEEWLKAFS